MQPGIGPGQPVWIRLQPVCDPHHNPVMAADVIMAGQRAANSPAQAESRGIKR